jgi:hypothetical protein
MVHQSNRPAIGWLITMAATVLLMLLLGFLILGAGERVQATSLPSPQQEMTPLAQQTCATVTAVPPVECVALLQFFTQTGGLQWLSNTHWLRFHSGNPPCDWYGITCDSGHVVELSLPANQLSGTLPLALGNLGRLSRLRLEKNGLQGRIPPTLCRLTPTLTEVALDYNALATRRRSVELCLQPLAGDWQSTQTRAVTALQVGEITTSALRLSWTPISYTADGGFYQIELATAPNGPFVVHGQTPDKQSSTYLVEGLEPSRTYYLQVRSYTPPHANHPGEVWSLPARQVAVTQALAGRVLVAAFFPADNDLASEIGMVVERFRRGTALNPNVQVVLLVDGRQDGDTRLLTIARGQITPTTAIEDEWRLSELDTADPAVLTWFLQYARAQFPAERTVVTLMGHGIPLAPEVTWGAPATAAAVQARARGEIPPLPKEHEYSPSDITNRGYMSAVDVGQALLAATDNGATPFDVLFFDQCFQGNLDVLYEVYKSARVIVASPNYAWLTAAYDRYLTQFTPTATPEAMAQAIIDRYQGSLDDRHPNTIFWVQSSDIPLIVEGVSRLGDALQAALAAGDRTKIIQAVQQSKYVDTTQCGRQNLQLGPPDELLGIESLANHLQLTFGAGDPYGLSAAVDDLKPMMQRVEKRTRTGHPYLAQGQFWDYGNSLTILAPLPPGSPPSVVWRASLYRADTPFTATWTIDPAQPITMTASLAAVRDGRWDEFLAEWYGSLPPTVGQWCHYIPREQVVVDETAVITLTATISTPNRVQLAWTPSDDTTSTDYWLQRWGPYDISWTASEALPLTQTTLALSGLEPGTHRFSLLARNPDQELVAQSNEVAVEIVADVEDELQLFLPLVRR